MPQPLLWAQINNTGDIPTKRSGHTMMTFGNSNVMFGGIGIPNELKKDQSRPDIYDEVYILRIGPKDLHWSRERTTGSQKPCARAHHLAVDVGNKMLVFGGHTCNAESGDAVVNLNDTFILDVQHLEWSNPVKQEAKSEDEETVDTSMPSPRANCAGAHTNGVVYVFGGHGGRKYQRVAFNDLWCFNLATGLWSTIEYVNTPCDPRAGHSVFIIEDKLYIYGGWNLESQFNDIALFNLTTKEWSIPDIMNESPRWNFSSIMVEAIPSWKYIVFGGAAGDFPEGGPREFANPVNTSCVLDIETLSWMPIRTEDEDREEGPFLPPGRENASVVYDSKVCRIIVFGGWANEWLDDSYGLNVSSIVGPPYAITQIIPRLGQLTGGTTLVIKGVGFKDSVNINIRFICGKNYSDVSGVYVSDTECTCVTPNFEHIGPKECEVRLSLQGGDLTNTFCNFSFFMNSKFHKCLAYGPGLLEGGAVGSPTAFIIQARNNNDENRTSGGDNFVVKITQTGAEPKQIDYQLKDNDDGTYLVTYQVNEACAVSVDIQLEDEKHKHVSIRSSPFPASFEDKSRANNNDMLGPLMAKYITESLEKIHEFIVQTGKGISLKDKDIKKDVRELINVKEHIESVSLKNDKMVFWLDCVDESIKFFQSNGISKDHQVKAIRKCFDGWASLKRQAKETSKDIASTIENEKEKTCQIIKRLEEDLKVYSNELKKRSLYYYKTGFEESLNELSKIASEVSVYTEKIQENGYNAEKFGVPEIIDASNNLIEGVKGEAESMKVLWDQIKLCQTTFENFMKSKWIETKPYDMEEDVKKLQKVAKDIKCDRKCNAYVGLMQDIKNWLIFLPLIAELRDEAMRERHWIALKKAIAKEFNLDDKLTLRDIFNLNLGQQSETVEEITDQAKQEARMEKTLNKLEEIYSLVEFELQQHKQTDVYMLKMKDEDFEALEENYVSVNAMFSSRFLSTFEEECNYWQKGLASVSEVYQVLTEVQRSWSFLENLFIHSEEVKKELPKESEQFVEIDKSVKSILAEGKQILRPLEFCTQENIMKRLEQAQYSLNVCEKALNDFMDGKRRAFPRFYFVSTTDLLDILSNGNNPTKVMVHMPKIFQAIDTLHLKGDGDRPIATGFESCVGKEDVEFDSPLKLAGKVESYLADVIDKMRSTLRTIVGKSNKAKETMARHEWLLTDPSQITLVVSLISWVHIVEEHMKSNSLAKGLEEQKAMLIGLINIVRGDIERHVRTKVMCMITMDTHSRDILDLLVKENVKAPEEFQWQSQLKAYYDTEQQDCRLRITDAAFWYGYEYLGNGPRLVVTPLTDRIYVTATQALHLKMGCAPAGPAGTGKTETTKDLSSAMGKACYVFNCSDQMDYKGMGGIFKGLASSGSWGCFDEFNRLVPEVLSVCSVQFKSVTDAIKAGVKRFRLQEDEISLDPTCGVFITMNPGYLGRSELPEGLKALFRPITVIVPDLELICENMLMAEGFTGAKLLAKKFTTLYALCKDLLSKQMHYDWGLRAIKSVLVVAGGFIRDEPNLDERALLMRALRDFNLPKIVAQDLDIFMGLINDLFPNIDVPRKRNMEFEAIVETATKDSLLWPEAELILKVVQLRELLEIRHCVFIIGSPGCGKSSSWKVLARAQDIAGQKTTCVDINPKSISANELYGFVMMSTREWRDGLLSKTMRTLVQEANTNPKWIILDGDLDANWIESMNSVMDDNKILTLASNERIRLKPHMRLIFEIRDLVYASPATVSRAGILFISDVSGYQWKAYVKSWIKSKSYTDDTKEQLQGLFDKYLPETLLHLKKYFKFVVPVVDIQMVVSQCRLLESILDKEEIQGLEYIFVFSCVWSIGAGFTELDGKSYRKDFSNWWKDKWKTIKYPSRGGVFDYYVDTANSKLEEWSKMLGKEFKVNTTDPISSFTVPTTDTVSFQYLLRQFISVGHAPLLVGNAGCGKTQISKGLIKELAEDATSWNYQVINFNFYTDSMLLQGILEQNLEKRAGKTFAPPGKAKLIYFIDDLNMPKLDPYNTQTAIALLRQHQDYGHWYDRTKLTLKDIINTQKFACMNPTAGSFYVNPRLQRHFWMLAVPFPESSSLFTIYSTFLNTHFAKFKGSIQEYVGPVIKATLALHGEVEKNFRKTAKNFHYEFNVRHLTNIFQGILSAKPEAIKEADNFIKLWVHESDRIYGDRLVSRENINVFKQELGNMAKKSFPKFNLAKCFNTDNPEPIVFASFVNGLDQHLYDQFASVDAMSLRLGEALREYNSVNPIMDLVLFEDAMSHVCRISRIVSGDGGHALLVGVGGSGKQSLSRLAAFILSYTLKSIMISSTYGMNDLKTDLQEMYNKSGVKDEGVFFLFTEGQITDERFLVYINDLLSSGEIVDLYAAEDKDAIVNNIRPAVKGAGILDNKDNCWNFFIARVRRNLHMSICFSPVGESFRNRARKFPALVNCTIIDWFHPWPDEALLSVAKKFTDEIELESDEIRKSVSEFMPYSLKVVNTASQQIYDQEKRYVYTTPKSFLELIKLFKAMFGKKKSELENNKDNYELGVVKLKETGEVVSKLEEDLKIKQVEVEEKKKVSDAQAEIVGVEKAKVEIESEKAEIEAQNCAIIQKNVDEKLTSVQKDLDEALPLVERAQNALNGLDIGEFRTMKAYAKPPKEIVTTFSCVLNILATLDKSVPVDKNGRYKSDNDWKAALGLMKDPAYLIQLLQNVKGNIDAQQIPQYNFKAIRSTINNEEFTPEIIKSKSAACAGICDWVKNITLYYDVVESVEPKRKAVKEAQEQLRTASEKKAEMDAFVATLNAALAKLRAEFQKAMDEKEAAENEASRCARRLDLAQRLVNALGSESERWSTAILVLTEQLKVVVGDVLLAAAFVSYVGPFNKAFRDKIIQKDFMSFFTSNKILMSQNSNVIKILTDEATIAAWNNCKLPADRVSIENGCILTSSERYPLMIDPQLQGITWIKKEKDQELKLGRLTNMKRLLQVLEASIAAGNCVLIENMEESIDAVLASVYSRATIKRGRSLYLRLGDKEIALHPSFRLYLHTKLSNPHYPPEIQAECTLINFTVTEAGLEDQILTLVVRKERPDLAQQKEELIQQQNEFKIKLKQLERELLHQLTTAEGDILENITLIENLESSKKISIEIQEKVEIAKVTEARINDAAEAYRPAGSRGALVFFLMNELYKVHSFYKFSLDAFVIVVNRAIDLVSAKANSKNEDSAEPEESAPASAPPVEGEEVKKAEPGAEAPPAAEEENEGEAEPEAEEITELTPRSLTARVSALIESISYEGFAYTRRGLFVRHRLLVATMLCLRILVRSGKIDQAESSALVKKEMPLEPRAQPESLKFMPDYVWAAVLGLESVNVFSNLTSQMEGEFAQWRKWYQDERSEEADLPKSCKEITEFQKLLLLRAMRPDRLTGALTLFIEENLGKQYIDLPPFDIFATYSEMKPKVPMFFVLFPGVDPTPDVERVGESKGITAQNGKFVNISMGQGQEEIAAAALTKAGKEGGWVMLQNVHLMVTWMKIFERQLEVVSESQDLDPLFRCFISSEPPPLPDQEIIPESILQNSIKVSNEAPQDLKANLHRAFAHFTQQDVDQSAKPTEFKALLFGLCVFHSLILGRRKFGSQGWSKHYNFNDGDLTICADVLQNYLRKYEQIPYSDLQYIYGEIMYGGHITDEWDRRTNNTYLKVIIQPSLFKAQQLTRAPGFKSPDPNKFDRNRYEKYIEESLPAEIPQMFGLHPNAEIGYLTTTTESLFQNIMMIQGGASLGTGKKQEDSVKEYIDKFLKELPEDFIMLDVVAAFGANLNPYQVVCIQECERMNALLGEVRTTLSDLDAGLKGQLNITEAMEQLSGALFVNRVPDTWAANAYFSKKTLGDWFVDLLLRVAQIVVWVDKKAAPFSLWISGLFNPMSFLTAIMQVTAREFVLPLDSMCLQTDVTNVFEHQEITAYPEKGMYIHGLFLEGAQWEKGRGSEQGNLTEMVPKILHPSLPVVNVKAVLLEERKIIGFYRCPVYVTTMRGPTYVFTAFLKMENEEDPGYDWVLAGVALMMSPD